MSDAVFADQESLELSMETVAAAFAMTRGRRHALVYANAAFRRLMPPGPDQALGTAIADTPLGRAAPALIALLDRAIRTGVPARDQRIESLGDAPIWHCSVWPDAGQRGQSEHLIIEVRPVDREETSLSLQRDVAERMLLRALDERDHATTAEASRRRATFLASEGRRLSESLDEVSTREAVSRLILPQQSQWCIVDIVEHDGAVRQLAVVHPDGKKQAVLRELIGSRTPKVSDSFGAPAVMENPRPVLIDDRAAVADALAAHDPETLRALLDLGVGPLLSVPLVTHGLVIGAVTFVAESSARSFSAEDISLAEDLAVRGAMALENARMYGETVALKALAEAASDAKSRFLGTMSHELRTPLNAIGGYVDLIDLGLRGPVTDAQHVDLERIRVSQQHLVALITDVLNFVRVTAGRIPYTLIDVALHEVVTSSVALIEPLILSKQLVYHLTCDSSVVVHVDRDRLTQIVVNLLSNAIKFTGARGRIAVECGATGNTAWVRVADTGVGIAADKLEAIFEPFMQVTSGLAGRDSGVGLGLAISRDLARGMAGDLTVESELGVGSTFTLRLPRVTSSND
jgi:signal transduction histidine kinase